MTTAKELSCVALIPARSGSKRVKNKNVRLLGGHPLLAYTIATAKASGVFKRVIVSTDSAETAAIAKKYGAEVPWLRPTEFAADNSPDIEWLEHTLQQLEAAGETYDAFALLRPTSPFRQTATIQRAWNYFTSLTGVDSIRAIELCTQHPAKMWQVTGEGTTARINPVMVNPDKTGTPWHSTPYQALPKIYAQNASLEIAWTRVPLQQHTIAGREIAPFITEGHEGFDINNQEDWIIAEYMLEHQQVTLPIII
ncbi:MAG: hypothetical protein ACD_43C00048G0001 [uncultured bacterium]|nr:MAG: hypothetical protein ACD_43C00048G0001 [uncultured bacterium]